MSDTVKLITAPVPTSVAQEVMYAPEGLSIAQMIEHCALSHPHGSIWVFIGSQLIPQDQWASVRPKSSAVLQIRVAPMGGGGGGSKNPFRTILQVAVIAAGAYFGAVYGASLGSTLGFTGAAAASVGAAVIGAATTLVGGLLVNAIAPPPSQRLNSNRPFEQDSPTHFIEGARNELRPFGAIPVVLGKHRMVPPLAAKNFTETVGDKQYVRQIFLWGYGPVDTSALNSSLKIGETPLSDFDDIEFETSYVAGSTPSTSLYPEQVYQEDYSILLTQSEGYQLRTSQVDADELIVELTFPRGLYELEEDGTKVSRSANIEMRYAPAGTNNWTGTTSPTYTRSQTNAVRVSHRWTVSPGQYDVQVRRTNADGQENERVQDDVFWTSLKTVTKGQPVLAKNMVVTAVRMRATDQLNGTIDRLNGEPALICLDWDSGSLSWVERTTRNPASLYRYILQSPANQKAVADSRLDLETLQSWHEYCETEGYTYNSVIDFEGSVEDRLRDVASAGRARPARVDELESVVIDRQQTTPVQHFSPRNTWDYRGGIDYPDTVHAFRCQFINEENGYRQDEIIVYDDGYDETNATVFETLEMPGITDPDQIWKQARQHIATGRLRPDYHEFTTDIEYLVARRGDLVTFSHDVLVIGQVFSRIATLTEDGSNFTGLTFEGNEAAVMTAGKNYSVLIRRKDGTQDILRVNNPVGLVTNITFQTPVDKTAYPFEAGDLITLGESDIETLRGIIQSIRPGQNETARIKIVNEAPEIHTAGSGTIPPYVSVVGTPPEWERPNPPVLINIQSGENVMVRSLDGSVQGRMVITLQNDNVGMVEPLVKMRPVGADDYDEPSMVSRSAEKIVIEGLTEGTYYDLRINYRRVGGSLTGQGDANSSVLTMNNVLYEGTLNPPPDVENFQIAVRGNTIHLSWDPVEVIDMKKYALRFTPETSTPSWDTAIPLQQQVSKDTTTLTVPGAVGSYLIKAVDEGGRLSTNAAIVTTTINALDGLNVVAAVNEHTLWGGTYDDTAINDNGHLQLSGDDSVDDWTNVDLIDNVDIGANGLATGGTYTFADAFDLGDVYTSVLTADMTVSGLDVYDDVDLWDNVDLVENVDGANPSQYTVQLQVRTTNDDPTGTPTWSDWRNFTVGEYTARAFEFRVILSAVQSGITPVIERLVINIDMPDRIESSGDIVVTTSGRTVSYPSPFRAVPDLAFAADDMDTGDYYVISNKTISGFTIQFFNSAGGGVERSFSYVAKGYGKVTTI